MERCIEMIEFKKPTGAGKYKGCDSCGNHENVFEIRFTPNGTTTSRSAFVCRHCAKLMILALDGIVEEEVKLV
jgi:hypothetical protein